MLVVIFIITDIINYINSIFIFYTYNKYLNIFIICIAVLFITSMNNEK